jgi:hypothetical protein
MSSDAVEQSSGYRLRVTCGVDVGKSFTLVRRRVIVGRSSIADFEINELSSPRRRFAIDWLPDRNRHVLEVWPHKISVFVNGKQCDDSQTIELAVGDRIRLAATEFVFERMDVEPDNGPKKATA